MEDESERTGSAVVAHAGGNSDTKRVVAIQVVEKLRRSMPSFPPVVGQLPGFKEHLMDCGTCFSWSLFNRDEVSCARWFNSSGTVFPQHSHDQKEYIIVYRGSMILEVSGEKKTLQFGDSAMIAPGHLHSVQCDEDCEYIAIVIPKSKDWPE